MASARAVIGAKHDANATELIKAIAGEFETGEGRATARDGLRTQLSGKTPPEIVARSLEILKQAAAIVGAKVRRTQRPSRAGFNISAGRFAEASTEGGFLGFGGVRISDAEKATLAQISASRPRGLTAGSNFASVQERPERGRWGSASMHGAFPAILPKRHYIVAHANLS